jgi:hypothetical protein
MVASAMTPNGIGVTLDPLVAVIGDPRTTRQVEMALSRQGIEVMGCVEQAEDLMTLRDVRHPHVVVLVSGHERDDAQTIRTLAASVPHSRIILSLRDARARRPAPRRGASARWAANRCRPASAKCSPSRPTASATPRSPDGSRSQRARSRAMCRRASRSSACTPGTSSPPSSTRDAGAALRDHVPLN